jgi:hypothetical protein
MKSMLLSMLSVLVSNFLFSQDIISASGGNANGSGSSSYTVGQLMVSTNIADNGSVLNGIQQSIEVFTLGNEKLQKLTLKAVTFPNPTKDKIILSLLDNELGELFFTVFDVNGRLLKTGKVNKQNTSIAMKSFPAGIYLLKVHQNKKSLKVFKIIKN